MGALVAVTATLFLAACSSEKADKAPASHAAPPPNQTTDPSKESYADPIDRVHPDHVEALARKTFRPRYGGAWIDRDVDPPVLRIAVKDATAADRARLAEISNHDPQVALAPVRFTFNQLLAVKDAAGKVLEARNAKWMMVAPRLIQQNVQVTAPAQLSRQTRAAIRRRAGSVPVRFVIHPLRRVPASSHVHAWTVQKYRYRGNRKPRTVHLGPQTRSVPVTVETGYCVGQARPSIARLRVNETAAAVTITAYLHKPAYTEGYACAGVGYEPVRRAHLRQPLGDRRLFDGAFSPPRPVPAHRR